MSYGSNPEESQALHQGVHNHLTSSQKLLMTLMRIRRSLLHEDLAVCFVVNQSTVSRPLNTWIPILERQLEQLIQWPQTTIGPAIGRLHVSRQTPEELICFHELLQHQ